jgi:hypothetical protein
VLPQVASRPLSPVRAGLLLLAGLRVDDRYGMELQANPGSLGLTRFLPWNQSPSRGFLFSEHRGLSKVNGPASEEPPIAAG